MRYGSRWSQMVSGVLPHEWEEEPLVLTPHELHWIAVAVRNQAGCEEKVLRFLEETRAWADDPAWHELQVENQRQILAGYRALARRLTRLDPEIPA